MRKLLLQVGLAFLVSSALGQERVVKPGVVNSTNAATLNGKTESQLSVGNASALGGLNASNFITLGSELLVQPDRETIQVFSQTISTPASIPSAKIVVLNTNLTALFPHNGSNPFLTTNRVYLGAVESLQTAVLQGAYDTPPQLTPPTFPVVQMSHDNITWQNWSQSAEPVYLSIYHLAGRNAGATNIVVTGFERTWTVGRTNDFNGQIVLVDMLQNTPRQVVNQSGATNIAVSLLPRWANYPAMNAVNLAGNALQYSAFWSSLPSQKSDGTLSALAWQYNLSTVLELQGSTLSFGSNAVFESFTVGDTNLIFQIYTANLDSAPTVTWTTNLSGIWTTLTQTTNYLRKGSWIVEAAKPSGDSAFFKAFTTVNEFVSQTPMVRVNGGLKLDMRTSAPTAREIGGTVGSVTNFVIINLDGVLKKYWSDGETVWSANL